MIAKLQIVEFKASQGFDRNQGKFSVCINVPEPYISPRYVCLFIMQAKNVELTAHVSLLRYPQEIIIYYYREASNSTVFGTRKTVLFEICTIRGVFMI